jgi:hypothetical protein
MESESVRILLKEHTFERDRLELATGDVLDVKAGLLLVMLIFLAEQTEAVFRGDLSALQRWFELISILGLIIGGVTAIVQLLPKQYRVLSSPVKYQKWLHDLRTHFSGDPNPEAEVLGLAERTEIAQAIERIETNEALNKSKVLLIKICFYGVIASFAANIATLISRHLFQLYR